MATQIRALSFFALLLVAALSLPPAWCHHHRRSHARDMAERYEKWIAHYGRTYKGEAEKKHRFQIFQTNVRLIDYFNARNYSYSLKENQFADLTNKEFKAAYTGLSHAHAHARHRHKKRTRFMYENATGLPDSMDWREKGAVTPIKDQGQCGCCWAFSAVAATEGINKIKAGKLVSLSEQELVDCDVRGDNDGCNGGYMDGAFKFIQENGGLNAEDKYPYKAARGTCNDSKSGNHAATISGYEDVPTNSEKSLLAAIANQPVSVAIDADGYYFQFYSSGVFDGPCDTELNHGVTAVGYGEASKESYWLVKNSWGSEWGEEGYLRMKRGVSSKQGLCGIAMLASYPTHNSSKGTL